MSIALRLRLCEGEEKWRCGDVIVTLLLFVVGTVISVAWWRQMESSNFKIFQIAVETIVVVSTDRRKPPRIQRWFQHYQTKTER